MYSIWAKTVLNSNEISLCLIWFYLACVLRDNRLSNEESHRPPPVIILNSISIAAHFLIDFNNIIISLLSFPSPRSACLSPYDAVLMANRKHCSPCHTRATAASQRCCCERRRNKGRENSFHCNWSTYGSVRVAGERQSTPTLLFVIKMAFVLSNHVHCDMLLFVCASCLVVCVGCEEFG